MAAPVQDDAVDAWLPLPALRQRPCVFAVHGGQDNLAGYLTARCAAKRDLASGQRLTVGHNCPGERHQAPLFHVALSGIRDAEEAQGPPLVMLCPRSPDDGAAARVLPLADVASTIGLGTPEETTAQLGPIRRALEAAHKPHLVMLNKLDKLVRLEPNLSRCHAALVTLVEVLGVNPVRGECLFGRGSLEIADGDGAWGFTLPGFASTLARVQREKAAAAEMGKSATASTPQELLPRLWYRSAAGGEPGFVR